MKKIIILILVLFNVLSKAQELSIEVDKNPALVGEQILITYSINQKATNFTSPNFQGLRVLSGPNPSTQSSYSFINGKSTSTTSTTYSFYLQATQEGNYNITPASIIVEGQKINSKSYTLKILKQNPNKINQEKESSEKLFIKAEVNKKNIVIGEQILVTYKLFARSIDLYNTEIYSLPNLNGFWQKDLENSTRFKREIINGIAYNVATIKKTVLTAQKSGKLIIDPLELKCGIRVAQQRNNRDPFASFFGSGYNIKEKFIKSKSIKINVSELPTPPKGFSGIVGNLNISSSIDNSSVNANDAITYNLTIKGKGNFELINDLKIDFPDEFEIYDPKINKKIFKGGLERSIKTFEYLMIPREKGEYIIPETYLIIYNPESNSYETKQSSIHSLTVMENKNQEDDEYFVSPQEVIVDKEDIYHIHTDPSLIKKEKNIIKLQIFSILLVIPILSIIFLTVYNKFSSDKSNFKWGNQKANKIALKRMRKAQHCIDSDNFDKFFEEIEKALWGYFADKFKVNSVNLSKDTINAYFKHSGIDQNIKNVFVSLLDECEFARYSPAKNKNTQMDSILKKAKTIIIDVETALK